MTVIHAVWSSADRLHLWGELPLTTARLPRPRGRAPAGGRPRRHPYAAKVARLREALGTLTALDVAGSLPVTETTVLLPSTAQAPLPSPDLPGGVGATARPRGVRPWRADALELRGSELLAVLLALPPSPPPAARPAPSLTAAAAVALAAVDVAARGHLLPGLVTRDGQLEARWLPRLDAADRLRLADLAASLPPALRAFAGEEHRPAGEVVRALVEQLADTAARDALAGQRLAPARRGRRRLSPEEAWLAALTAPDPAVDGDPTELQLLAKELDAWHASGGGVAALRTAFRLLPPAGGHPDGRVPHPDGHGDAHAGLRSDAERAGPDRGRAAHAAPGGDRWRVEFVLQGTDDLSLQVPAADLWGSARTLRFLDRTLEAPQERLLADLGRATRLYPPLERALDVARPDGLDLDVAQVVDFLRDAAPLLEQAGFGLLLPAELRRPARLGARLKTTSRRTGSDGSAASGLLGHDGIVDYRWEVAVGDETLTAGELRELARLKAPLVRVRGRWVELRDDDLDAALRLLQEDATRQMDVGQAVRVALGAADPGVGLPVVGVDADGPLGALLSGDADRRLQPLATPDGFGGTLRPYQERGLAWLTFLAGLGLGACLADDMGLGKTLQLLALLVHERQGHTRRSRRWPAPTLLICPMSIVGNWEREAARFAPRLRVHVHHGTDRFDGAAFARAARASDLVVTTYSLAARDRDTLTAVRWSRLALDEAQHIKNPAAKQSQAIRSLPAAQRVALTGTPVENRLAELWSIMDFCNPGLLGSQRAFRSRFAVPIEKLHDDAAAERLRRVTGPFVLRRLKTDRRIAADLPDKLEFDERCNLTREQASLYQAVVDDMLARIDDSEGIERKGLVLTTMLRLKQVCNHPAHLLGDGSRLAGRSGKLARLEELLDEVMDAGERALVFTQFAEWGARLQAHLRERFGREVLLLHGGVAKRERDRMVEAFQGDRGPAVFVLSLKAGGVGLNLTAANHVIHYDRWWNPAVEDQATDRAFRIGQRRDVQVRRFVCVGTLEERIAALIAAKRQLAERVVGSGEAWLTELSTDELRAVVALSGDAVAE